jgi:uncharacterized protein (TIGR03067 family)
LIGLFVVTRADEPKPDDRKKIEGTWTVVRFEDAGRNWEDQALKASGFKFELKDGNLAFKLKSADPMKSKDAIETATYKLDDKTPTKSFDTKDKEGKEEKGIYKFEDDKLMLCIAPPGKDRPSKFETKETPNRLFVLERDKTSTNDKEKPKDKDPMKEKDKDAMKDKDKDPMKDKEKDKDAKKDKDDKKDKDEKKDK